MPYSDYLSDKVNDLVLNNTSFTLPTSLEISLHSADPGPDNSPDTEISGGSYARQAITFATSASGVAANDTEITFTLMPTVSITHIAIWDQSGNMLYYDDYSAIALSTGDNVRIPVGAIEVTAKTVD